MRQARFLRLAMYLIQRRRWANGRLTEFAEYAIIRSMKYSSKKEK